MTKRASAVSGHFYPDTKEGILEYFSRFEKSTLTCKDFKAIRALVVPHAGYIYSGQTAYFAYHEAQKHSYKRAIVIGPSHRVGFEGASISLFDEYETPFGEIGIDLEYANTLKEKFSFLMFHQECHKEHSTETQAPFIKHFLPNSQIIEIVYSQLSPEILNTLVDFVLQDEENLLVISTDLSHFYDLQKANKLDNICIEAIKNQDNTKLYEGCEACGKIGVSALLQVSQKNSLNVEILDYTTSHKHNKNENSVVGYVSAIFGYM